MNMQPTRCLEDSPTPQSVQFAGVYINLSAISRLNGLQQSHLSRIFSGKRYTTIATARKIADALGMPLESFLDELDKIQTNSLTTRHTPVSM